MGTVYWFTGLSGAGKTTIGRLFYRSLKEMKSNTVFLDGDDLRAALGHDLGYTLDHRKKSAMRNSKLCKLLADQDIDVVCATISMFHECREWNRENIPAYREIYINVPMDVLIKRDHKGLYSGALKGEIKDVVGLDLAFEEPRRPDLTIVNDGSQKPDKIAENLLELLIVKGSDVSFPLSIS